MICVIKRLDKFEGKGIFNLSNENTIVQVAMGGVNGELWQTIPGEISSLHREIADVASIANEKEEDVHIMEQYFSSPTLRRLILNSIPPPAGIEGQSFSAVFWSVALKTRCKRWAQGHR